MVKAVQWICMILALWVIPPGLGEKPDMGVVHQWKQLEFDFPSAKERQQALDDGSFQPGQITPIDMDVHYSHNNSQKRVFISVVRYFAGVPATLGTVTERKHDGNPIITPYPSWSWHKNPEQCKKDRIVSVLRMMIDECQRLWLLDTGRLINNQTCPPQILAFDLKTDKLVHRFEIPSHLIESRSILVTPVVDVRDPHGECQDTFVYVADTRAYSIIVHDVKNNVAWKASDKSMYPYPNYAVFHIMGVSFEMIDGVFGMALSPYKPGEDRILFYHSMTSPTENWVYTSDLRNRSKFEHNPESSPEVFHTFKGERKTQSAAQAMDKNGVTYFGLMSDVTLNCWNSHTNYGPKNFGLVSGNHETMQFVCGVKVVTNKKGQQELWVITIRFQKVTTHTLNTTEVNYRILSGRIEDLIDGTVCKTRNGGGGYEYLLKNNTNA